jgi:hypothetical protein
MAGGKKTMHIGLEVKTPKGAGTITELFSDSACVRLSDGYEYDFLRDDLRFTRPVYPSPSKNLHSKMKIVYREMSDQQWRTLKEISKLTGYESLTGLSAAIRALRKPEFGSHVIEKRKLEGCEYEYRLVS